MAHAALSVALACAALATLQPRAAQTGRTVSCPVITVSCPDSIAPGAPATFTANISNSDLSLTPTFKWTVPAGSITGGQDTSIITVDTTGLEGRPVEATVEVGGLPSPCGKTASCATVVLAACGHSRRFDEYGDIRFNDEKARLDNFAVELQNDPAARGYIVAYGGRRGREGEARARADRARGYLVDARAVDPSRVSIIDGGHREDMVLTLYLWPPDAPPPEPGPTVDPSEVEIIPEGPAPKRPARKPRERN